MTLYKNGLTSLNAHHFLQVPGFTHPVTDVYLDEILPMIGYSPSGNFMRNDATSLKPVPKAGKEFQAQLDDALTGAFLDGSEASFRRLLQVQTIPQAQ